MPITQDQTENILQELLGFENITDKNLLRKMISEKMSTLTKVEKLTIDLKIGQKIKELENYEIGVTPPGKKIKVFTIISFAIISFLGFWLPAKYKVSLPIEIIIYIFSVFWGLSAIRATYALMKKNKQRLVLRKQRTTGGLAKLGLDNLSFNILSLSSFVRADTTSPGIKSNINF